MEYRDRIKIANNFVTADLCRQIISEIDHNRLFDLEVFGASKGPTMLEKGHQLDKAIRDTQSVGLPHLAPQVNGTMQRIVSQLIEPEFDMQIDYWEEPQVLVYRPGGHYKSHNDGEHVVKANHRPGWLWERVTDRDISVVWYLNEDFTGGELAFPRYDLSIQPRTGMVVAFPSTHDYVHGAKPVIEGIRYAIVTWLAAVGTPRVLPSPPPIPHVKNGQYACVP